MRTAVSKLIPIPNMAGKRPTTFVALVSKIGFARRRAALISASLIAASLSFLMSFLKVWKKSRYIRLLLTTIPARAIIPIPHMTILSGFCEMTSPRSTPTIERKTELMIIIAYPNELNSIRKIKKMENRAIKNAF